ASRCSRSTSTARRSRSSRAIRPSESRGGAPGTDRARAARLSRANRPQRAKAHRARSGVEPSATVSSMGQLGELAAAARQANAFARAGLRDEGQRLLDAGEAGRAELRAFLRTADPRSWITLDAAMRAFRKYRPGPARQRPSWWWRMGRAIARDEPGPEDV